MSSSNTSQGNTSSYLGSAPYTAAEKKWLNKNYGGEFKFLMTFGLKMYNEEDREEGRAIARSFMQDDEEYEERND